MSNLTIKGRKSNFNKIFNNLNIKLIKGCRKDIQYMVDCIDKGKSFRIKYIDSSNKNECMVYCNELPYGILSYSSYINLEEMIVVYSVVEKNEYNFLGTKSEKNGYCLKTIKNAFILRFFEKIKRKL